MPKLQNDFTMISHVRKMMSAANISRDEMINPLAAFALAFCLDSSALLLVCDCS